MTTESNGKLLASAGLLAAVLAATLAADLALPQVFEPLAHRFTDSLFRLRSSLRAPGSGPDGHVVHVAIDDQSLRTRFDHYLDRTEYARVVTNLGLAGVAAQFHDSVFAAPQEGPGDAELIRAVESASNAYFGMAAGLAADGPGPLDTKPDPAVRDLLAANAWDLRIAGDASRVPRAARPFPTFPALAGAARGIGFLDITADQDGVYRRTPLIARLGEKFIPSLPLRVVCDFLDVAPDRIVVSPGRSIVLGNARMPGTGERKEIRIPVDQQGRMIVNFLGPWGSMTQYPLMTVYDASDDRFELEDLSEELHGKIAIVSEVAAGRGDLGPVPVDPVYPLAGIHANTIHGILTGDFLRELGSVRMLLWVEIPLLLLLLLGSLRLRTVLFVTLSVALVLVYHLVAGIAFLGADLILDIPRPVVFMAGSTITLAAYHYHLESRARAVLRSTFDAYFPPAVVDKIMVHSARLASAAHKKELTILFSDIVSFTGHTARLEAGKVRSLLNEYFEKMVDIVFESQGTLDKFIGDGLMVFFGDPEEQGDHAERCVRAAVAMQRAAHELDQVWQARGDMPLRIRIGINTGQVIVGNMGSSRRLSYTVLGEPVNLAQRLESIAPEGGILISERTRELVGDSVPVLARDTARVKGFDAPVAIFEVPVTREARA